MHYRDAARRWRRIDGDLHANPSSGVAFGGGGAGFHVDFAGAADDTGFMRFGLGGSGFALALVGANSVPTTAATPSAVELDGVYSETDARYGLLPDGVKESIVLHDSSSPSAYRFTLRPQASTDLRAVAQDDGSVAFYANGGGEPAFTFEAPIVSDSQIAAATVPTGGSTAPPSNPPVAPPPSGASMSASTVAGTPLPVLALLTSTQPATSEVAPPAEGRARLGVQRQDDGSFRVTVQLDPTWLQDPARVFPVLLDPSITTSADIQDGYYNTSAGTNLPNMSDQELLVGRNGSTGSTYVAPLKFNLASLPPGAKVTAAKVSVYWTGCIPPSGGQYATYGCPYWWPGADSLYDGTTELHRVTSSWSSSTQWSQFSSDPSSLASFYINAFVNSDQPQGWRTLTGPSFATTVQQMLSGSLPNYGFVLQKTGGNANVGFKYASSRWSDPDKSPRLDIDWVASGVQVAQPMHLHSYGAELSWQHYSGGLGPYALTILGDTPTAFWRMDDPADSALGISDWTGHEENGTVSGTVSDGEPGATADGDQSLYFDGSSGYVEKPPNNGGPLMSVADTFTLEAWIRRGTTSSGTYTVFSRGESNGGGFRLIINSNNKLELTVGDGDGGSNGQFHQVSTSTTSLGDTAWHYVVATKATVNSIPVVHLYVDGVDVSGPIDNVTMTNGWGGVVDLGAASYFDYGGDGARHFRDYFNGWIDEAAVYSYPLTPTQVQAHMSAGQQTISGFQRFEVHRSTTPNFTPSGGTLIATLADPASQSYRDTTAKPSTTFYYKVVTVTSDPSSPFNSNEVSATLPADGQAQVTIQPGVAGADAEATSISSGNTCANQGGLSTIPVDAANRGLITFDLRAIPSGVTVTNADLDLFTFSTGSATVSAYKLKSAWAAGSATSPSCNESGASWNERQPSVSWATAGGDYDPTAAATVSDPGGNPHWDDFPVTSAVQSWIDPASGSANFGLLLKQSGPNTVAYASDDYSTSLPLRPKLIITYTEPVHATGPAVAIGAPAPGAQVSGTVLVSAGASDDGKVTSVQFMLDGSNLGSAITSAPYSYSWNTSTASRGSHTLAAVATDDAGNTTTSSNVQVTVANSIAPAISINSVATGGIAQLTTSNAITDATRGNPTSGDGRTAPDSSYGIWQNTTNLDPNGGAETNSTGFINNQNTTVSRDTTTAKFGNASFKAQASNNGLVSVEWRALSNNNMLAVTAGTTYTFSLFQRAGGSYGESGYLQVVYYASDKTTIVQNTSSAAKAIPASWQGDGSDRLVYTTTAPSSPTPAAYARFIWADSASVALRSYNFDGVQVEAKAIATPYVETSAGSATRNGARVQAPAALLTSKQGWFAVRFRADFGSTDLPYGTSRVMLASWGDDGNNKLQLDWDPAVAKFGMRRQITGGSDAVTSAVQTFSAGTTLTLVGKWTATSLGISVSGGAFSTANSSRIPLLQSSTIDIGRANWTAAQWADADVFWFADGPGTLSDTDAGTLNGFGNSDPALSALPGSATAAWPAVSDGYASSAAYHVDTTASDDYAVSKVDFFLDGTRFATDTASPWTADLDTLAASTWNGTHTITAKAYDADGNATTSTGMGFSVTNNPSSEFSATITTSNVPAELRYDPSAQTQDTVPLTVALTNTSSLTWTAANVKLRYQWFDSSGALVSTSSDTSIGSDLAGGGNRNVSLTVSPPTPPAGMYRGRYTLRIDLYDASVPAYFAGKSNQPFERAGTVNQVEPDALGQEAYQKYDGYPLGTGYDAAVELGNGNLLVSATPFSEPGRGLGTVVGLTYNSLESGSVSPLGNNWSLAISGLVPFGTRLDVHPNATDTTAGRTAKWIGYVDGDGSYHRFNGRAVSGGTYYDDPVGVHLYLRATGQADPKYWALTQPDRTTYYFDQAGYPTSVTDADGNALTFTETSVAAGDDVYGLAKQINSVTDAGGRSFTISYYTKSNTGEANWRGKVKQIVDHIGHATDFDYYYDGNLRRVTEEGGTNADGSYLAPRTVTFNYTNTGGTGAAITTAGARANPDPATVESNKLYSVIDARGNETSFAYVVPTGATPWRIASVTPRLGTTASKTSYSYTTTAPVTTTVARPLSRTWTYTFDSSGRNTQATDPLSEQTSYTWTSDNQISRITEPTGQHTDYVYNENGLLTDRKDELGDETSTTYESLTVDSLDVAANWEAGRSIPHQSRVTKVVQPQGNATTTNTTDYTTSFDYTSTTADHVWHTTDALGNVTTNTYNDDGTLSATTYPANADGIVRKTTYVYDANGLATSVTDDVTPHCQLCAPLAVHQTGYAADGAVLWTQDPDHSTYSGGDPTQYRTYNYYDSFGRLGRSSTPRSTKYLAGMLVWNDTVYDANDDILTRYSPHYGLGDAGTAATTTTAYDVMDMPTSVAGPRITTADGGPVTTATTYDAAERAITVTKPNGVKTAPAGTNWTKDFETDTTYDSLDRVSSTSQYAVDSSGAVDPTQTRTVNNCYDLASDVRSVTGAKGASGFSSCPAAVLPANYVYTTAPYTKRFEYDAAHRRTNELALPKTGASWLTRQTAYNANGTTTSITDENGKVKQYVYDDRGSKIKEIDPYSSTRTITALWEYDALGNVKRYISPRGYDQANGGSTYTYFVTVYSYDALSRLTKTTLPYASGDGSNLTYTYLGYDANGNQTMVSLPTTQSSSANLGAGEKTITDYWDTGQIYSTTSPGTSTANPAGETVRFDYTADGWQAARVPELPSQAGVLDLSRAAYWDYYPDGLLKAERDEGGERAAFSYDADGSQLTSTQALGITQADQAPFATTRTFNGFDQTAKTRAPDPSSPGAYLATLFTYDLGGLATTMDVNRQEDSAGNQTANGAGRTFTYSYDQLDRLLTQLDDFKTPSDGSDDEQTSVDAYTATGLLATQTLSKANGSGGWTQEQQSTRSYFDNGLLKQLTNYNASGAIIEQHTLDYVLAGGGTNPSTYLNGNKATDTFKLVGPDNSASCWTTTCTASWSYDGRDRLTQEVTGTGTTTTYTLDTIGNITQQTSGSVTKTMTYNGQQLSTLSVGSVTNRYIYDAQGNVDCVVDSSWAAANCPTAGNADLLADDVYDYKNRLSDSRIYNGSGSLLTSEDFTNDALNRTTAQTVTSGGSTTTTSSSFVGDSALVSADSVSGTAASTRAYSYDAAGRVLTIAVTPSGGATTKSSYVYDPHGSVSLVLGSSGVTQAYGYLAYGGDNAALTKPTDGSGASSNVYRYSGRRLDDSSQTYGIGARRYAVSLNRWMQADIYDAGSSDFRLAANQATANRYLYAGANPANLTEVDGHVIDADDGGGGCESACGNPPPPGPDPGPHQGSPGNSANSHHAGTFLGFGLAGSVGGLTPCPTTPFIWANRYTHRAQGVLGITCPAIVLISFVPCLKEAVVWPYFSEEACGPQALGISAAIGLTSFISCKGSTCLRSQLCSSSMIQSMAYLFCHTRVHGANYDVETRCVGDERL